MLLGLASAKGAPGVTTTARALAAVWPTDVVLADCDPSGGDLAVLGRTADGDVLDPERGLLSLAAQVRRGAGGVSVEEHVQRLDGGLDVLCGVAGPEQMSGIAPLWPALSGVLRHQAGANVVADLGRLVPGSPVAPLVQACDALVLVTRPAVEAYAHLRERLRWLATMQDLPGGGPALGVLVVADPRESRVGPELSRLLGHSGLQVPVIGVVADDRRAADVLQGRVERGIGRSLLVRSSRALVGPLRALADTRGFAHAQV